MFYSGAGVTTALCSGLKAGQKAVLRLYLCSIIGFLALLWSTLGLAVPAGAVISNTASISYSVSGVPGLPLSSNNNQFTVSALADNTSATMSVGALSDNIYAGSTHITTIVMSNTGTATLGSQQLNITAPLNSQINLSGSGVSLISNSSSATTTTSLFRLPNLSPGGSQNLQLTLTAPAAAVTNTQTLVIEHHANGIALHNQIITMNLLARTRATLEILQYSHSARATPVIINTALYKQGNGTFAALTAPALPDAPGVLVTDAPVTLEPSTTFSSRQTLFIRVTDPDHNLDNTTQESLDIELNLQSNDERETLRLRETGIATGIFSGYITLQKTPPTANDGYLHVHANTKVTVNYTDEVDGNDSSVNIVLIDPYGEIFDSATGQPLDGYTVQMINADTGMAASVYGDDGVSSYPATMITGSTVTDSGGNIYTYGSGEYRFPFAPAGNYKLIVTAPSGAKYSWPSTKATELLYNLPLEHLAITLGSRGERFPLLPGPPLHIDIPVDPLTAQLYIQRSANQASVAAGDFIRYSVSLENITSVSLNDVVLSETLPRGFRLQKGSVVINGNRVADPLISADGTTFSFDFSAMAAGARKQIEYVSAVGAVPPGIATSSSYASANSGAAASNRATHDARILDELMRGRALLMGQIIIDATDNEPLPNSGIKGVRLYMEDGRYAVSDEQGKFHFDNVTPGSHVVQLDLDTLPDHYEVVMGDQNSRFAGRAWSQFVDLQGGTLWRTDFHVARKPTPTGNLSLQVNNAAPQENGDIPYQVDLQADTVGVSNLRLTLMIPASTEYLPGSSHFGGKTIGDPDIIGNVLTYRLGDSDNTTDWRSSLHFTLHSNSDKNGASELITKASLLYDTPAKQNQRLPLVNHMFVLIAEQARQEAILEEFVIIEKFMPSGAALKEGDKAELQQIANKLAHYQNIRIHAIGHSDNLPILRQENRARFANNQVLSEYRAQEVANYLRDLLQLPPGHITIEGKAAEQPITSNATPAGRAANRRVQLYIYRDTAIGVDQISGTAVSSDPQTSTIKGITPGAPVISAATAANPQPLPSYDSQWLAQQGPEIDWLVPQPESLPAIPSADISIKHQRDQSISLTLNGVPVAAMNFNGTLRSDQGAAVSSWGGVDLDEGDNLFNATIRDAQGALIQQLSRNLHYSSAPVRAEIVADQSILIADSITQPVIAVRLYDKDNYPIRAGMEIEYSLNAPYQAARNSNFVTDNMAGAPGNRHYATADKNGVVLITLQATNSTDDLILMLPLANNKTVELKSRLKAKARDWILIGMAEGSAGFNTLSGNLEGVEGSAAQDHLYRDDRIAFFAKGQVLGKWLLTMAYDTDSGSGKDQPQKNSNDPQLFQAIDPGSYYTVYGDAGQNGFDAASSNKLYLKLERDEFYLLFGDYQTNLNDTKLARYDRTLTGIKSRYQDEKYDLMLFVSESNQAFIKDELRGQGSTGPYKVSRSNIALNTEIVTIEARDRFRSDVIVSSKTLARHSDYDINYLEGNITFREPVFSTDANLNPQYIVIRYEAYDERDATITSGSRAEVKVNDKLKVGLSQVSEGRSGGDALLGATDLHYKFSDTTTLRLEAARSLDSKESASSRDGNAYLAEVEHQTANSNSKLYLQDNDSQFGLGQINASESGMRKRGVETNVRATDEINIKGQAYRQENSATHATRDLGEAQGEIKLGDTRLRAGLRDVQDQRGDGSEQQSQQLTTGVSQNIFKDKVTLRADREFNLNSGNDSIDFPDKTLIGADYHITDNATLFAEQEVSDSDSRNTRQRRLGIKSTPWNGGELYSGLTQTNSASGDESSNTTSANVAARQKWQLNQAWSLDVGAEESRTLNQNQPLSQPDASPFNINSGFALGNSEDFSAASLGLTYTQKKWLWTARIESRNGDITDRRNLVTSVQTSPQNNLSLLASLSLTQSDSSNGEQQESSTLQLGLAYRPNNSRWLLLDKLQLKKESHTNATIDDSSWRIINLLNANYKSGRWQTSLQYGAKSVKETIDGNAYSQFVDLTGIETRYDLTPEWDVGLHGNILHAWQLNQYDYNSGISLGHTVARNIWVSLGYNFSGFRDADFSRSNYTSKGLFLRFRMKFDQASVKDAVNWASQ